MSEAPDDYTPEKIEYYLAHWGELQSAAEGGTGGLNGSGGGGRDRLGLACLLADLERAADDLPSHWSGTLQIFRYQARSRIWAQRRLVLEEVDIHTAVLRMARSLGWSE